MYGLTGEKLWIDDTRPAPSGFRACKSYNEAIAALEYFTLCEGGVDLVCFDHDLGGTKTGYDIAKYIVEKQIPIGEYRIHSMNPVGAKNIYELLNSYGYKYQN